MQEGHADGGGLTAAHGLGCYPLGVRTASSPRPVTSRPSSGRSMRFPSPPGVSDLWRSESAASLASMQSTAFDSFPGTPVWSPVGPAPHTAPHTRGPAGHSTSDWDCVALAQMLADEAALQRACGRLPPLGPPPPAAAFDRDAHLAAAFSAFSTGGPSVGGIGQYPATGTQQQAFSGTRVPSTSHTALRCQDSGAPGWGEPMLFEAHAGVQGSSSLAQPEWSMHVAALASGWQLVHAA